ncbi:MAG: class I SAM-dependent methyltransferase [Lachnospiraceae bacterium]|jgi:SAM-dependent methyltransferase|nr:class I SAM-dependent methyltransferase [Lachnospiraceae bacterium]
MEVFQDYAYYYNAFYRDKNYRAEAEQVNLLLKKYGKDVKRIINFGCGTGKHDMELTGMGYQCMGIDMSQMMIDIARENTSGRENIDFSVADIRQYKTSAQYDAVISLFHVMSYQNTNEDILKAFRSARAALSTGGTFLFDVWYGPGVLSDKPTLRVKEIQDDQYRLIRIARPVMHDKTSVVDVCYEILVIDKRTGETKTISEVHSMRYFFRPELESYLEKAGFELIDNLDCATLEATDYDSWTSYFVARAV